MIYGKCGKVYLKASPHTIAYVRSFRKNTFGHQKIHPRKYGVAFWYEGKFILCK